MKISYFIAPVLFAVLATTVGCGRSLDGTYSGSTYGVQVMSAEFKPGGKVFVTSMGGSTEGTYHFDGDKVIIDANGTNMVLTVAADGSLSGGPMGISLRKKN
jgi:hypothetical protein